nr:MucR family transcriptional regulator [Sphingomonas sp. CARO-RG-8B-R24-01]
MHSKITYVGLAAEMTIAWLSNPHNRATVNEVPAIIKSIYDGIAILSDNSNGRTLDNSKYTPAVSVRKSLESNDYILSMIDGKPYKALRRHLTSHGLTPEKYRERYGLKPDYPVVSRSYSAARRAMAIRMGLGRKSGKPSVKVALNIEPSA